MTYKFSFFVFIISVVLLGINVYGVLFGKYEQPDIASWGMGNQDRILKSLSIEELDKKKSEADEEYFNRVTLLVNHYLIHAPSVRTAIWDNYFLWLHDVIRPENTYFYENMDLKRSLEKGVGLCSQHSNVIYLIFSANGYESRIVRLFGHVVAAVKDKQGKWFIADADYGIVIPLSLEQIEQNPASVNKYYDREYKNIPADVQLPMEAIYGSADNNRMLDIKNEEGWKKYYIEIISDYLKWPIPLFLISVSFFLLVRTGKQRNK